MIATTSLLDIDDVEGFVARCLVNSRVRCTRDEHDELLAEGITILYELANRYEPHRPGYSTPGRFSGYAASLLPRRMQDAYYRLHPEHQRRNINGKRVREHGEPPISLHAPLHSQGRAMTNGHGDAGGPITLTDSISLATTAIDPTLHANQHEHTDPTRLPIVASAMSLIPTANRHQARPILAHIVDQVPTDQIAHRLGTTRGHVVRVRKHLEIAIRQAQTDAQEAA